MQSRAVLRFPVGLPHSAKKIEKVKKKTRPLPMDYNAASRRILTQHPTTRSGARTWAQVVRGFRVCLCHDHVLI